MLKKVYFISKIFISILIIFSMLKSCAQAVDTTIQAEIRANIQKLCEKQAYGLDSYAYQTLDLSWFNSSAYVIIIGKGNNNNYSGTLDTTNKLYIIPKSSNESITNRTNDVNNSLYNDWAYAFDTRKYYLNGTMQSRGSFYFNNLLEPFYCYTQVPINTRVLTLGAGEEHGGSYIVPTFEFTPSGTPVTFNGISDVNAVKYRYIVLQESLGQIQDLQEYYKVVATLKDSYDNVVGSLDTYTGVNNRSMILSGNNYILYGSTMTEYNQLYTLTLDVYEDFITYDTYTYYYVFLPQNATISGGVITNVGSGDFTNQEIAISNEQNSQDVINAITNTSEVDSILSGNLPTINNSGDVLSFAEEMGYFPIEFPFTTFLMNLVEGLYDSITIRQNVNLSASYKTLNLNFNSSDFVIPDNTFKLFIRNMLIFIYIYGNYKYIHYLFSLLYTARINELTSELGTDEFYDKDYM